MPKESLYGDDEAKFNLRLPRPLYEAAKQAARRQHLSLNQWLVLLLEQATTTTPSPDANASESTRSC